MWGRDLSPAQLAGGPISAPTLPIVREPSGWYSGTGALIGITVRVELDFRPGVVDVHQYGVSDWQIFGVPWKFESVTEEEAREDSRLPLVLGKELDEGLKGTVVEGIDVAYNAESDSMILDIHLRVTRWAPRVTMRATLPRVVCPVGAKFEKC
jgi:hypothetical protein